MPLSVSFPSASNSKKRPPAQGRPQTAPPRLPGPRLATAPRCSAFGRKRASGRRCRRQWTRPRPCRSRCRIAPKSNDEANGFRSVRRRAAPDLTPVHGEAWALHRPRIAEINEHIIAKILGHMPLKRVTALTQADDMRGSDPGSPRRRAARKGCWSWRDPKQDRESRRSPYETAARKALPHLSQKLAASAFSCWQDSHCIFQDTVETCVRTCVPAPDTLLWARTSVQVGRSSVERGRMRR